MSSRIEGLALRNATMAYQLPNNPEISSFVESDFSCLREHMTRCAAVRERFPRVRSLYDSAKSFVSSRIVSCAAIALVVIIAATWSF